MSKRDFLLAVLSVFFVIIYGDAGNHAPLWLTSEGREQLYPNEKYFVEFMKVDGVRKRRKENEKLRIKEKLKRDLSQRIHLNVKSKEHIYTIEFTHRDKTSYIERFTSDILIFSDIDLTQSELVFYYNTEEGDFFRGYTLYGIICIKKEVLALHYIRLLQRQLNLLELQLNNNAQQYTSTARTREYTEAYESDFQKINDLGDVILATGHDIPENTLSLIGRLRARVDEVYQHIDYNYFENKLKEAHEQLLSGKNKEAFTSFSTLKLINPGDERIELGYAESKMRIEKFYISTIEQHRNNLRLHEAIQTYDEVFDIMPFVRDDYINDYRQLEKEAYRKYSTELKQSINNNEVLTLRSQLQRLNSYGHIDNSGYMSLMRSVDETLARDLYEQAKISYHRKDYNQAIRAVDRAVKLDDLRKYRKLDNRARNKLYNQRLKEFRRTRPHKYAFQIGLGIQHNMDLLDYYLENKEYNTAYMSSYSLGLYRKFNVRPNVFNGRDQSYAHLIGLKYTYMHFGTQYIVDRGFKTLKISDLQTLEMILSVHHNAYLSFGLVSERINLNILEEKEYFVAGATLIEQVWPVAVSLDLKAYYDGKSIYPVFTINLFLNINLYRDVDRYDKNGIRFEVDRL